MVEYPNGDFYDLIVGKFKYIKNGVLIDNKLNESYDDLYHPISGGYNSNNHNRLNIGVVDYIKHKSATGYFTLVPGTNPQQAKWYIQGHARILIDDEPSNQGFSLPSYEEIILVKAISSFLKTVS